MTFLEQMSDKYNYVLRFLFQFIYIMPLIQQFSYIHYKNCNSTTTAPVLKFMTQNVTINI